MRIMVAAGLIGLVIGQLGSPARADDGPTGRAPTTGIITTHGRARGRLANTIADVSIGVEAHAPTVAATQAALASASEKLMSYLRQQVWNGYGRNSSR